MAVIKTLDFIADHVATSHVEEIHEQVIGMLFEEGIIEETDDIALCGMEINYVLKEVVRKISLVVKILISMDEEITANNITVVWP